MKKIYSWAVVIVLLSLCIVACRDGYEKGKTKPYHVPYAIDRYHIPTKCTIESLETKEETTQLLWLLKFGNEGSSESYISAVKNKELFTKIALEHGEDGSGFMTVMPLNLPPLFYGLESLQAIGIKGGEEVNLSQIVQIRYNSSEDFIHNGYKHISEVRLKEVQKSLATLTPNDYLWIPEESFLLSNRSEVEGKFDRIELRVVLKDGKTLRANMPI